VFQPISDWRKVQPPEDSFHPPQPDPSWKAIAEALVNENDETKLLELSQRLVNALEKLQGAS
jgi:hypothetical protein